MISVWLNKRLILHLCVLVVQFWCKTSYLIFIHFIRCHKSVDIFIHKKKIIHSWTLDSKLLYFQVLISSDVLFSFATPPPEEISNSMYPVAQVPGFHTHTLFLAPVKSTVLVSFHGNGPLL